MNVSVSAYPAIEFELLTAAICPGSSTGFVEVAFTSGDAPLATSLDGSSFAATAFYEGQNSGSHAVQVKLLETFEDFVTHYSSKKSPPVFFRIIFSSLARS